MIGIDEALNGNSFIKRLETMAIPTREKLEKYIPFVKVFPDIQYIILSKNFDAGRGSFGKAQYWESKVKVHPGFMNPAVESLLRKTLDHEIAHIYAYHWRNKVDSQGVHEGHGFYWGSIMIRLGYNPYGEIHINGWDAHTVAKAGRILTKEEVIYEDCPVCKEMKFFNLQLTTGMYKCECCGKEIQQ